MNVFLFFQALALALATLQPSAAVQPSAVVPTSAGALPSLSPGLPDPDPGVCCACLRFVVASLTVI